MSLSNSDEAAHIWVLYNHQVKVSNVYRNCVKKLADYLSHLGYSDLAKTAIVNLQVADETVRSMG